MLVLSRKPNDSIVITGNGDGDIVITVVRVSGNRVTIGIEAPPSIKVQRSELLKKKRAG